MWYFIKKWIVDFLTYDPGTVDEVLADAKKDLDYYFKSTWKALKTIWNS
jgi:hypothetical protein